MHIVHQLEPNYFQLLTVDGVHFHVYSRPTYCTVLLEQKGRKTIPFGRTFHGIDCLQQAVEAYKDPKIKAGLRTLISSRI